MNPQTQQLVQSVIMSARELRLTANERDTVTSIINALVSEIEQLSKQCAAQSVAGEATEPRIVKKQPG